MFQNRRTFNNGSFGLPVANKFIHLHTVTWILIAIALHLIHFIVSCRQCIYIALDQSLETVVTFHFSGGKVYSLNKGCHTCMIKHTMHVQLLHCSIYLTWLDMCIYRPRIHF